MSRYNLKYHRLTRRRRRLDEHPRGPLLRLGLYGLAGLFALCALGACFVLLFYKKPRQSPAPAAQQVQASPSPAPTATPVPPAVYTGSRQVLELSELEGQAIIEPHLTKERILFVSGPDAAAPHRLYAYDLARNRLSRLFAVCRYDQLRHPVENEDYLVYLDITAEGRGDIRVRDKATGKEAPFVQVLMDAPSLFLEGSYLAYTARTGADRAELYLADLAGGTGITLARFVGSTFGASLPDLGEGKLVYGHMLSLGEEGLVQLDLSAGERIETPIQGPIQNPRIGSGFVAFETGIREPGLAALLSDDRIVFLADRAEAFAVTEDDVIYQENGQLFAVEPCTGVHFALTEAQEDAVLLAAGDGLVLAKIDDHYEILTLEYTNGEG